MVDAAEAQIKSGGWHYHPDLPIRNSELFIWPPRPMAWLRWLRRTWLTVAMTPVWLGLAAVTWFTLMPDLQRMQVLAWDWVVQVYAVNLAMILIVAGGLHLYFYRYRRQGMARKFDPRFMAEKNETFTLNDQVWDNMFWTIASGVTCWTAFQVLYLWGAANGVLPWLDWAENPVWFALFFVAIPIWSSMHFYWIHRWLHWKPLYRVAHALHHRNVSTGPWTGISMHPIEHVLYYSSVAIHFVLPSHPIHMIFHLYVQSLNPPCSHSGYESLLVDDRDRFALGDFFHQLHHRHFECNYGTAEMPWDKWFGSFHDGTREATQRMRRRQRRAAQSG